MDMQYKNMVLQIIEGPCPEPPMVCVSCSVCKGVSTGLRLSRCPDIVRCVVRLTRMLVMRRDWVFVDRTWHSKFS
jgi:hypothetical protein